MNLEEDGGQILKSSEDLVERFKVYPKVTGGNCNVLGRKEGFRTTI